MSSTSLTIDSEGSASSTLTQRLPRLGAEAWTAHRNAEGTARLRGGKEPTGAGGAQQNQKDLISDVDSDDEEEAFPSFGILPLPLEQKRRLMRLVYTYVKATLFFLTWLGFTVAYLSKNVHTDVPKLIVLRAQGIYEEQLPQVPPNHLLGVTLKGHILLPEFQVKGDTDSKPTLFVQVFCDYYDAQKAQTVSSAVSEVWQLELLPRKKVEKLAQVWTVLELNLEDVASQKNPKLRLQLSTKNFDETTSFYLSLNLSPIDKNVGVICAGLVLAGFYALIIWEIVDSTFAAMMASTTAIGVLAWLDARPSFNTIIQWINFKTMLLLFSMMVLVSVIAETGVFDYCAVLVYRVTRGKVWPLLTSLFLLIGFGSGYLDEVTTVLLLLPITLRLCEVLQLKCSPVLISLVCFSNIGGTMTAVGIMPNVIISSNSYMQRSGVNFTSFFVHVAPGVLMAMAAAYALLRFLLGSEEILRYKNRPIAQLRHSILTWQRTVDELVSVTQGEREVQEQMLDTIKQLKENLRREREKLTASQALFQDTLIELEAQHPIRNKVLLTKALFCFVFVIFLFCQPFVSIEMSWAALLGAILLLILADKIQFGTVLSRIEWSTLIFFAALFITIEAVALMGLIEWLGGHIINVVLRVDERWRLAAAILIVLWVSALFSAVLNSIPVTTMMVKLLIAIDQNQNIELPLLPLVWALSMGAGFGGNGTLLGASANLVCSGVAKHHGYGFTFVEFFKIGFLVMLTTVSVAMVYLMIAHVVFEWH